MPKKHLRKFILLVLFILSLVLISVSGGVISYALFYAVLIIPLISFLYLIYVYICFKIYQKLETRNITAGEQIPYSFIIRNEGFTVFTAVNVKVYTDFSYVSDVPDNHTFRLFPGDKIEYNSTLVCRYRGEYKAGVRRLILTDFLELFRLSYQIPSPFEVIVKPRIIDLDIDKDIPDLDVHIQSNFRGEINEPDLVVRDYIPGDSLKKIHWKSTAKSMALKVRNDITVLKEKVLLVADFERISDDIHEYLPWENKVLEQTIGLVYHFVFAKIPIELVFKGHEFQNILISDVIRFNYVYEQLSMINFRFDNHFLKLFFEAQSRGLITEAKIVLMVIHYIDDELFAELAGLSQTSKITVIYVITNMDISGYCRQSTERFKIIKVGFED